VPQPLGGQKKPVFHHRITDELIELLALLAGCKVNTAALLTHWVSPPAAEI